MRWKWPYITRSGDSRNRNQPTDFAEEAFFQGSGFGTNYLRHVFFLLVAATAVNRTFHGGISGIVTDPTGGVVLGAEIKASNEATGLSYVTAVGGAHRSNSDFPQPEPSALPDSW